MLLLASIAAFAQSEAAYIPDQGQLFVFSKDTLAIFGDMINQGSLGTMPGSVVNFSGQNWENQGNAQLPDESTNGISGTGGTFRFLLGNNKNLYSGTQYIQGGYQLTLQSGSSFPNISIANSKGVYLADLNDLLVRNNLNFENGDLYLNGWNLQMGINNPGTITGYNEQNYIITDTSVAGGFLYRSDIPASDTSFIFPVGTNDQSYSPAAIAFHNGHPPATVGMRVFDHVFASGNTGTINDLDYVKKTWDLKSATPDTGYDIALQHDEADEGPRFTPYRDSSYISYFNPISSQWDVGSPIGNVNPGLLTTGSVVPGTYMNTRLSDSSHSQDQYISVSTLQYSDNTCPVVDFTKFVGVRYNLRYVELFWQTSQEMNVAEYVIQRRLQSQSDFQTIATVNSKSVSGFSNNLLYYYLPDFDFTDDWTYYRIEIIGTTGCVRYSDIIKVPWDIEVSVTPNPNWGNFEVHIFGVKHPVNMRIINESGQILHVYQVDNDQTINVANLPQSVYFLEFLDPSNGEKVLSDIKVIVLKK
jgi:hypothetical protein